MCWCPRSNEQHHARKHENCACRRYMSLYEETANNRDYGETSNYIFCPYNWFHLRSSADSALKFTHPQFHKFRTVAQSVYSSITSVYLQHKQKSPNRKLRATIACATHALIRKDSARITARASATRALIPTNMVACARCLLPQRRITGVVKHSPPGCSHLICVRPTLRRYC